MDQTGVLFEPGVKYTYEEKGAKQVAVAGKDAKRVYTLCVSSSAAGDFLPIQQICSGKTTASCPSPRADGMQEAKEFGVDFTFTGKQSHYSTLDTMKRYVRNIIIPYRDQQLVAHPEWSRNTPMILLLDCYPVHTGKDFSSFIRNECPFIILLYIPANCTGMFQPADVGLQRFLKHFICKLCIERRIAWQVQQVRELKVDLRDLIHSDSIKVLRDTTVRAIVQLHKFMISEDGRRVVRKAWEKCVAGGFSLADVTSFETRLALEDYLASAEGEILNEEILEAQRRRAMPGQGNDQYVGDAESSNAIECQILCASPEDDLATPSHVIISHTLNLQVSSGAFDNSLSIAERDLGLAVDPALPGLSTTAFKESVFNYDANDELLSSDDDERSSHSADGSDDDSTSTSSSSPEEEEKEEESEEENNPSSSVIESDPPRWKVTVYVNPETKKTVLRFGRA